MKLVKLVETLAATLDQRVLAKRSALARTVTSAPGPDDYLHAARGLHDAAVAMTIDALWRGFGRGFGALRYRIAALLRRGQGTLGRHQAAH